MTSVELFLVLNNIFKALTILTRHTINGNFHILIMKDISLNRFFAFYTFILYLQTDLENLLMLYSPVDTSENIIMHKYFKRFKH